MLLGASGAFVELRAGLNQMWRVTTPPPGSMRRMVRERFISFLMVLAVGLLFLFSLLLNAAIAALDRWFAEVVPAFGTLLGATHLVVSFGMGLLLFAMIFRFLPDARIPWPDVW